MDIKIIDRQLNAFRERVDDLRWARPGQARTSEEKLRDALAELELAQEELQVCVEEIDSSRQATTDRDEGRLRLLAKTFAELPVATFLVNTNGSIRQFNQAASDLFGLSQSYLTQRPLAGLIELGDRSAYRSQLSRVLREDVTATMSVRLRAHHGRSQKITLSMKRLSARPNDERFVAVTAYEPASSVDPAPAETRPNASRPAASPKRTPDTPRHRVGLASITVSAFAAAASAKQALVDTRTQITNLQAALGTRAVIGQATGMLMVSRRLTADQAFALIIRTSQNNNIKVARLAEQIVAEPAIMDRL